MTSTRRRVASVVALALLGAVSACGDGGIVLPSESQAAAIAIASGDAQTGPVGAALGAPLVVLVTDAVGRPVAGESVTFRIDVGAGQVAPASALTDAQGHAATVWTLGPGAGPQRVEASVVGASAPLKTMFAASALSGAGTALVLVSGDAQTAPVKSALADSLVVRATDAQGNAVPGVQIEWSVTGGGTVSPASVVTDANGRAAAQRVLGSVAGAQGAQAAATGLTGVSFTHTAVAANPTALVIVSGNGQTGQAGAPLADSLVVRLQDADGNGVGGTAITWLVSTGGGSVDPVNVTTSPTGLAATQWTLGSATGTNVVNAVFSGLPAVQFAATAGAGAPSKLGFLQPPVTSTAGTTISPAIRVAIQDANGNTVTSATGGISLAIGTNPASGTLSGTTTVNAVSGVATFSNLSIDKAGSGYTLDASSGGVAGATSPAFDILTGGANRLVFVVQPTDRTVGQTFSPAIKVQAQDAGGNPVNAFVGTVTLTSSVTGSLSGTSSTNAVLGTATFNNLAVSKAGAAYTLTALSSGLASATSVTFDIAKASTTTSITGRNPTSSIPGQNVTVSYDVNIVSPGAGTLTGSVTVTDGTVSCDGAVSGSGTGSCALALTGVGTHQLTATYNGDVNFLESTSSPQNHTVNKASTSLSVSSDLPDPSLVGEVVTVNWNLMSSGTVSLSGTVTLTVSGSGETCSAPAALGAGSCNLTFTTNGARTINAAYSGDANYSSSTDTEGHTVHGETTTSLASNINPSVTGQSVTFTATVTKSSGSGTPSGSVRFLDGATVLGTANLNGSAIATFSTSFASAGSHSITAEYLGSGSFEASTSDALDQQVDQANRAPTAVADGYSVLEDGALSVNAASGVLSNDSDPDGDPITAVLVGGAPAHAASFTLNSDGSFDYTPDPNYNGDDTFSYRAKDASLTSSTVTVTITVTAVNDAPSFTAGGDQIAGTLDGPQSVNNWATGISAGPSNESSQTLQFEVSTSDDSQFSTLPAIDDSGTLTYTPDPLGLGASVVVTVRLRDSGGTANGGVDVSSDQAFTITLTAGP